MAQKKRCSWREHESPPPRSAIPATAPTSSAATPSSVFSEVVSLIDWWLIKSDSSFNGKRLAVGGMQAQGNHEMRIFTSHPIVKRSDTFTVETADGITLMLHGFINESRTQQNGIPPEVFRCFLFGFPYNWEYYADGDFGSKSIITTIPASTSNNEKTLEHSSNDAERVFPIHEPFMKLPDVLISSPDTSSIDDLLRRNFTFTPKKSNGSVSVDERLHASSDIRNCRTRMANISLYTETLERHETEENNQNYKLNEGCAHRIGHDPGGNASGHTEDASCSSNELHDGVHAESTEINNRVIINHHHSLTVNKNGEKQDEAGKSLQTDPLLWKGVKLEKDNYLGNFIVANSNLVAHNLDYNVGNLNDESTANSVELITEGVLNALSPKEQKRLHLQQCNQHENYAAKLHNHEEEKPVKGDGVSEDLPPRKDSVGKVSDSLAGKMIFPAEAAFESPPAGEKRNVDNGSTPHSTCLPVKVGLNGLSPSKISLSRLIHKRKLQGYTLTSFNRAARIRVQTPDDSEVLAARKVTNTYETDSLPVITDFVLETAVKSSENVKEGKLNDKITINSADSAVEKVSANILPTEGHNSYHKTGRRRSGYALRSLDHVEKSGVGNTGISEDSLERKDSESETNSFTVKMNVLFEPLLDVDAGKVCNSQNKKGKIPKSRSLIPSKHGKTVAPSFSASQGDNNLSHVEGKAMHVFQPPLTRYKAKTLSVTSPELLNLKRSRSGRVLVPPIDRWRQQIIYTMDGSISAITGTDALDSSSKGFYFFLLCFDGLSYFVLSAGSTTEPPKKRKLRK